MWTFKSFYACLVFLTIKKTWANFSVTPITTSPGLFYEKIGEVLLSNNHWNFVSTVDYNGYLIFFNYLNVQAKRIQEQCQIHKLEDCSARLDAISSSLDQIGQTDISMANFLGIEKNGRKRSKRSIWDFLTLLFESLNGKTSNSEEKIRELDLIQQDLQNKFQDQTTFYRIDSEKKKFQIDWLTESQKIIRDDLIKLESSFELDSKEKAKQIQNLKEMLTETQTKLKMQKDIQNKISQDVFEIQKKLVGVDEQLNNITKNVDNNNKDIINLKLEAKFQSISIDFGFLLTKFKDEQDKLYKSIENANRGNLDTYILSPLILVKMLGDINSNLPEGTKLPFYPKIENAHKLYNLVKPMVRIENNTILFVMQVPLVNTKTFNMLKMTSTPVPLRNPNNFAFILPKESHLLVDNFDEDYVLMSLNDRKDYCQELKANKYICKQVQPLVKSYTSTECEIHLFKNNKGIPDSCDKRVLSVEKPLFFQLQKSNSWIYATPESENILISCGGGVTRTTISLRKTGFLSINENCNTIINGNKITFIKEQSRPTQAEYFFDINLTDYIADSSIENGKPTSIFQKQLVLPYDFEYLRTTSYAIETSSNNFSKKYFSVLIVVVIIISLIIAYGLYKKRKYWIAVFWRVFGILRVEQNSLKDRVPSLPIKDSDKNNAKIKIKLDRKQNDIKRISMRTDESSTDPESEYLTVRFKVKKEDSLIKPQINQGTSVKNVKIHPSACQIKNYNQKAGKINEETAYLNELRKFKPMAKQ